MISRDISKGIDIIRGMSALGVIWGHSVYGFELPLELNGAFWVWIFLPISGYLIGKGFGDARYAISVTGYRKFLCNRALRIVPLYELALLLGLLIEQFGSVGSTGVSDIVRQISFSTSHTSLAGPLWTVTAEVHFYLVSILIVALMLRVSNMFFSVVMLMLSFGIAGYYNGVVYGFFMQPRSLVGNLHFFVFGLILSTHPFQNRIRISETVKTVIIACLVLCAWYIANWQPAYFWRFGNGANKYIPMGGAALIAMMIAAVILCVNVKKRTCGGGISFRLTRRMTAVFAYCGLYTYGIYVWHSVLAKFNNTILHAPIGFPRLVVLLLSIPIAVLSYRFIESWFLQFKTIVKENVQFDSFTEKANM